MAERSCHLCGCTQTNACFDEERGPCGWVDAATCSHCDTSYGALQLALGPLNPADNSHITLAANHARQIEKIIQHCATAEVG